MDEVRRLAAQGRADEGIARLDQAAAAGDGEALFVQANWRLWGLYGPRDPAAALDLMGKSAAAGWPEAMPAHAIMVGNGTGAPSDPARARLMLEQIASTSPDAATQLRLLDAMPARASSATVLSADPDIRLYADFLSADECAYLAAKAAPLLRPSMIIDEVTGRAKPHPERTSGSMNFDPISEDLVVHAIIRRIAALSGSTIESREPLHILRYDPGQQFHMHLDAIPGAANQREWTALIYLSSGYTGGATVFPALDIAVAGRPGECLLFRNCGDDGQPDQRTRHAGEPVETGTKWLASQWIRQGPYEAQIARG